MIKIKPCPFCNSQNIVYGAIWSYKYTPHGYRMICQDCGAFSGDKGTKRAARNLWNRRDYNGNL